MMELELVGEIPDGFDTTPLEAVTAVLAQRAQELSLPAGVVQLALVDDEEIQNMNREYAGHDYATDVLSFSYLESGDPIDTVIGEMVVSLETAARQAVEAEVRLEEEVALLAVHGILHIAGYDHQTPEDQERMGRIQGEVMMEAGYSFRDFSWE